MTAARRPEPVQLPSTEWLPASDDQSCVHLVSCHRYSTVAVTYNRNVVLIIDW